MSDITNQDFNSFTYAEVMSGLVSPSSWVLPYQEGLKLSNQICEVPTSSLRCRCPDCDKDFTIPPQPVITEAMVERAGKVLAENTYQGVTKIFKRESLVDLILVRLILEAALTPEPTKEGNHG